jgi:hypothetical protein
VHTQRQWPPFGLEKQVEMIRQQCPGIYTHGSIFCYRLPDKDFGLRYRSESSTTYSSVRQNHYLKPYSCASRAMKSLRSNLFRKIFLLSIPRPMT